MNRSSINYPSTMPSEQEQQNDSGTNLNLTTARKESESSKSKRVKLKKIQKKLILGLIFIAAITAYFGVLAKSYKGQIQALEVQEKLLNKYKKTFKNNPVKIINPRDGDAYTIEYFEAQVLKEVKDSFYIEIYTERPEVYLKPGGSYIWQDIEENINVVPGNAFSISMVFSRNNRKESTQHTFLLTEERGTLFSPNFDKFIEDEQNK